MQPEWLTVGEVAERLGISVQTARRWARDGKLPAEQHEGARGPEYRVRADAVPEPPEPSPPRATPVEVLTPTEPALPRPEPPPVAPIDAPPLLPRPVTPSAPAASRVPRPLPSPEAVELAAGLQSLRAEVRAATREQAAREGVLRTELEKTRTELSAALEALRQTRETVADLHRQLEDRDRQLESKTRALVAARRQAAVRESGRLNALRENLQEGQRPWWRRLKGKEKE